MQGTAPPRLRAELRGPRAVWITLTDAALHRPLNPAAYTLTTATGRPIPIATFLPSERTDGLLVPAEDLDIRRIHFLDIASLGLRVPVSFDGLFRTLYSPKPLGANVNQERTHTAFRVFAPRATALTLYLYASPEADTPTATHGLVQDADGVWECTLPADLHGTYYDFTVHGPDEPGNAFYERRPQHISDPYARVNVEAFGRSRVWYATTPATPLANGRPAMEDVVAYEVHVQDFTDLLPVDAAVRSTLPAMTVPGLTNAAGEPIGFDYLLDLGVNVVHLMPVQEFLHYPDATWREAFGADAYMQEMGVAEENYQWGYRTTHAFAIETKYRARGTEHGAQRDQFRDLVQAFHDHGIAVIVDFVFNHTGENMEGQDFLFNFNALDRLYYYRTEWNETKQEFAHIGPFGNEVKSENRPMVQRWIIDQCLHFLDEFGVDGFRIDLAGVTDKQTLQALMRRLPDDVIVYGEPWIQSADPAFRTNRDWTWYKADAPLTFFQDDTRNAIQGPPSTPRNKHHDRGWAGGKFDERYNVTRAIANSFPDERLPNRGINYLDIHDDWALADRFARRDWNGLLGVDEAPYRLAATLLMTSLGPVVLHGGVELMRSKGAAPLIELVKEHAMGATYIHGKRDTYNLRKPNQFLWETVGQKTDTHDFAGMHAYWRGLIRFRLSEAGQALRIGEEPPAGYVRFFQPEDHALLGYVIGDSVLVLANASDRERIMEGIEVPSGNWRLIGNGHAFDHEAGVDGIEVTLAGRTSHRLRVPAQSALVYSGTRE